MIHTSFIVDYAVSGMVLVYHGAKRLFIFIVMIPLFSFQCLFSGISHDSHNERVYYNRTLQTEYVTSSKASVFTPIQKQIPNNPYIIAARLYPGAFAVVNIT